MKKEKKKIELKLVALSKEMHSKVRRLAFLQRVSLKNIVEKALRNYYGWDKEK